MMGMRSKKATHGGGVALGIIAAVLPASVVFSAAADAPSWHTKIAGAELVTDLAIDDSGEGWAVSHQDQQTGIHVIRLQDLEPLQVDWDHEPWSSGIEPRLALGDSYSLVSSQDGVLRWDGTSWELQEVTGAMLGVRSVELDRVQPNRAVGVLARADLVGAALCVSDDFGHSWLTAQAADLGNTQMAAAAIHDGAVTVFTYEESLPWVNSDIDDESGWETLSAEMRIHDITVSPEGQVIGVGPAGHYAIGPVGDDLTLHHFVDEDGETRDLIRVTEHEGRVFLVSEQAGPPALYSIDDPTRPDIRERLPATGLAWIGAIAAGPRGRLLVAGKTDNGTDVILWRNRPPVAHPARGEPPMILEGDEGGDVVAVALDPDGDRLTGRSSGTCAFDVDPVSSTLRSLHVEELEVGEEHELYIRLSLPERDPDDCPGAGWPFSCHFDVTDGEAGARLAFEGMARSSGPSIGGVSPELQEVAAGSEVTIEIEEVGGCRLSAVRAKVLEGDNVIEPAVELADMTFSFTPMAIPGKPPQEIIVRFEVEDADGREAVAEATVRVLHPQMMVQLHMEAPYAHRAAPGELVTVVGSVRAETSVVLTGLSLELEGGLSVVPGTVRLFGECDPVLMGELARGEGELPEMDPVHGGDAGSNGASQGGGSIQVGDLSDCRGLVFLARKDLGYPSLSVKGCTWVPEGQDEAMEIWDCGGELKTRAEKLIGCSCDASKPKGAGGILPWFLLLGIAALLRSLQRRADSSRVAIALGS